MLEVGDVVDRWTVEAEIGVGGMAHVYRVRHNTLDTIHALKVLKVQSAAIRQRLVQEGKVQASLRHPNIVAVTDVIDVRGNPGLLMEYVDGPALDVWLADNRPTVQQAETIFKGILAGVTRAHRQGLVHRDLKPGNVLLEIAEEGIVPKVADFGLAKILIDEDSNINATRSGIAMGTPAYMAPEQVRDAKNVDQRADVFALGCILYEMLAGKSPFYAPDVLSIFTALADGRHTPVEALVPEVPPHLAATIRGCLAADREQRLHDCAAVRTSLETRVSHAAHVAPALQTVVPSAPKPISPPKPRSAETVMVTSQESMIGEAPSQSGYWVAAGITGVAALGVFAVLAGGGLWWAMRRTEPVAAPVTVAPVVVPEPRPEPVKAEPVPEPEPVKAEPVPEPEPEPVVVPPPKPTVARPKPRPEAPVESAPVPAPAPAPPTPTGRVVITGDHERAWLHGDNGRVSPGQVPVGEYAVHVVFAGKEPIKSGRVTVREGETAMVSCNAGFGMCRVK